MPARCKNLSGISPKGSFENFRSNAKRARSVTTSRVLEDTGQQIKEHPAPSTRALSQDIHVPHTWRMLREDEYIPIMCKELRTYYLWITNHVSNLQRGFCNRLRWIRVLLHWDYEYPQLPFVDSSKFAHRTFTALRMAFQDKCLG